jgi:hypothetical protein
MTVYKKLAKARLDLLLVKMEKSGHNKFADFRYFELGDFIPHVHKIFNDVGLVGVFCFEGNNATLTVHDTDGNGSVSFVSPSVAATKVERDGSQKTESIQDLGAKHTYMRRYLWLMAMEITEHDAVDRGNQPKVEDQPEEVKQKPEVKLKKEVVKENLELFSQKMIDWCKEAETLEGLTSLWADNQESIRQIKESNAEMFEKMKSTFSQRKGELSGK